MKDCAACQAIAPAQSRWKKFGAWVGLIFFCPCHLPLTITGLVLMISAAGLPIADSWGRPLLYAVFGGAFVFFLVVIVRMVSRHRDAERIHEAQHEPFPDPKTLDPKPGTHRVEA